MMDQITLNFVTTIKIPMYPMAFFFVHGYDHSKIREELESDNSNAEGYLNLSEDEFDYLETVLKDAFKTPSTLGNFYSNKWAGCLYVRHTPNTPKTRGTLSHEIYHLVEHILEMMGAVSNENNSEFVAYLIGWVTEEIYNIYEQKINPTSSPKIEVSLN